MTQQSWGLVTFRWQQSAADLKESQRDKIVRGDARHPKRFTRAYDAHRGTNKSCLRPLRKDRSAAAKRKGRENNRLEVGSRND